MDEEQLSAGDQAQEDGQWNCSLNGGGVDEEMASQQEPEYFGSGFALASGAQQLP